METKIIKYIVYTITMSITYAIINNMNKKKQFVENDEAEQETYIVRTPEILKGVFGAWFFLGIIMFCLFLFLKLKNNPTVTNGHLVLAMVACGIGVVGMTLSTTWRIEVNKDKMLIHRLLRSKIEIRMTEIERVEIGKKDEMVLYAYGKRITIVDPFCIHYGALKRDLKKCGRQIYEVEKKK